MHLTDFIKDAMRQGASFKIDGERIGLRRVRRGWFNFASGHYVVDVGSCFMWSDDGNSPWRVVRNTAPCHRQ